MRLTGWEEWADARAAELRGQGRWRSLRPLSGRGPDFGLDGRPVVSFASNDYLGLADHPAVKAAAVAAVEQWGSGTGSSRLIVGDRLLHHDLENELSAWRGSGSALVFPSGYQANVGVMTTFGAGALVVSDELNHASIIDGCRLARAEVAVFAHRDLDHAARLMAGADRRVILVSDSVFSMDGDVADVAGLADLARRHCALLVLDDAHAVFDLAPVPPGTECIRVGTLSKALGSQGGYAAGPSRFVDLLVNSARSFVYTTGLAPAAAAAALAALSVLRSDEGRQLVARLRAHTDRVREGHPSPIVPVVVGDEAAALEAAGRLLRHGLLVPAIRPPTVPAGTCRLRVSLSAAHRDEDVDRLAKALAEL